MKNLATLPAAIWLAVAASNFASELSAHPASGIVATSEGRVFSLEAGNPELRTLGQLWELSADGAGRSLERGGAHWLALDAKGVFARAESEKWRGQRNVPWLKRTGIPGGNAELIQADGMPLVGHRDGNLYYASRNLEITRLTPGGKTTLMVPKLAQLTDKLGGIKGLASGLENTLVATCPGAILEIKLYRSGSALVHPVSLQDCGKQPTAELTEPGLRGLTVDDQGTVYAAATSCGCVVKVTSDSQVRPILESESPWRPTGVAVHDGAAYVREYSHATSGNSPLWRPRVRRFDRDGKVRALFTAAEPTGDDAAGDRPLLIQAPGSPIAITGRALAAGDVNGDAIADVLLIVDKSLKVFFGGTNRTWQKAADASLDLAADGSEMTLADVNQDGKQDVVIAGHDSYAVTVLLGRGDGRFTSAEGSPFVARDGNQPHTHGLALADVNGDAYLDIVTANNSDGDLSLLVGDGKGKFVRSPRSPFSCGKSPYPIAASDINGDGYADVLVPNAGHGDPELKTLTVLLGSSRGDLAAAPGSPLVCDATVWYVAAGDLNGDKRPDLVATHSEGGSGATIFISAGQGKFVAAPGSPLQFGHGAWGVEIADMNRDGNADLVVAADESIRALLGDGSGRFRPAAGSPFKTGKGTWRLVVADFSGDGRPDVATRCVEANHLEIFRGN